MVSGGRVELGSSQWHAFPEIPEGDYWELEDDEDRYIHLMHAPILN